MGDRGDLLQAELFLAASYDQPAEAVQGDIGNLDQDIPHLSPVLHLAGFEAAELLLQLFDNGRDADIMNAGNPVRSTEIVTSGAPSSTDDWTL